MSWLHVWIVLEPTRVKETSLDFNNLKKYDKNIAARGIKTGT